LTATKRTRTREEPVTQKRKKIFSAEKNTTTPPSPSRCLRQFDVMNSTNQKIENKLKQTQIKTNLYKLQIHQNPQTNYGVYMKYQNSNV
jgi:hypothetical protein